MAVQLKESLSLERSPSGSCLLVSNFHPTLQNQTVCTSLVQMAILGQCKAWKAFSADNWLDFQSEALNNLIDSNSWFLNRVGCERAAPMRRWSSLSGSVHLP